MYYRDEDQCADIIKILIAEHLQNKKELKDYGVYKNFIDLILDNPMLW